MKFFKGSMRISKREILLITAVAFITLGAVLYRPFTFLKTDLLKAASLGYELSNFDFLYSFLSSGTLDNMSYLFVITPIFIVSTIYLINSNNYIIKQVRYHDRDNHWGKNTWLAIVMALILTLVLVLGSYLISGIVYGGFSNNWSLESGYPYFLLSATKIWPALKSMLVTSKMLPLFLITTFAGFLFMGMLVNVLKLYVNDFYTFIIVEALMFLDWMNILKFKTLSRIQLFPYNWAEPGIIYKNIIVFIIGFVILYFWGKARNGKMDQHLGTTA